VWEGDRVAPAPTTIEEARRDPRPIIGNLQKQRQLCTAIRNERPIAIASTGHDGEKGARSGHLLFF
jgi:hypothetical protein